MDYLYQGTFQHSITFDTMYVMTGHKTLEFWLLLHNHVNVKLFIYFLLNSIAYVA